MYLLAEFGKALAAFFATEIDDYLWLLILFARTQTHPDEYQAKYVCIGQICAFTLIYVVSLIGIVFGLFINDKYLGIIGFIPILIGLNMLREQLTENCSCKKTNLEKGKHMNGKYFEKLGNDEEERENSIGNIGDLDVNFLDSDKKEEEEEDEEKVIEEEYEEDLEASAVARTFNSLFSHVFHPQALQAFVITLMNSGDNIAIYIPLFATATPTALIVCFITFYVCVILLLTAAYFTAKWKKVAEIFDEYGHWLVPVLLIGLGMFIIAESGLFGGGFKV